MYSQRCGRKSFVVVASAARPERHTIVGVTECGNIYAKGIHLLANFAGVRPALWLKL